MWRPDKELYRYKMIHHNKEEKNHNNPKRFQLLNNWKSRWKEDGLSVSTFQIFRQIGVGLSGTRLMVHGFLMNFSLELEV